MNFELSYNWHTFQGDRRLLSLSFLNSEKIIHVSLNIAFNKGLTETKSRR